VERKQLLVRAAIVGFAVMAVGIGWQMANNAELRGEFRDRMKAEEIGRNAPEAGFGEAEAMDWLGAAPGRRIAFEQLSASLTRAGVGDVVPPWKLLRTNPQVLARCGGEPFLLPPRTQWGNIVPALRLVRDQVIPVVGRVDVASVTRDPALNECSGGANGSRHLSFSAIDLVPLETADARDTFTRLCTAWRRAGPGSRWGLGAYFDVSRPLQNRRARFHVDGTGWRTWGFSRRVESSGCHQLRGQ
jgi:hypothetical protein